MVRFKTVLITGASSGLGYAIALELARHGTTNFALFARRIEPLEKLAGELKAIGATAHVVQQDVSDYEAVIAKVQELDCELGGFDLVLANAGIGEAAPSTALSFGALQQTIEINVLGAMATLWAAMGPMVKRKGGTLAGMSSVAAQRGLPGSGSYSASKAALSTWLETLRADLDKTGVKVTDIRPGFVRTPMTDKNKFRMPFLVELDDAAARCVRDLQKSKAVCTFPAPMAWILWWLRRMPDWIWRVAAKRVR